MKLRTRILRIIACLPVLPIALFLDIINFFHNNENVLFQLGNYYLRNVADKIVPLKEDKND